MLGPGYWQRVASTAGAGPTPEPFLSDTQAARLGPRSTPIPAVSPSSAPVVLAGKVDVRPGPLIWHPLALASESAWLGTATHFTGPSHGPSVTHAGLLRLSVRQYPIRRRRLGHGPFVLSVLPVPPAVWCCHSSSADRRTVDCQ